MGAKKRETRIDWNQWFRRILGFILGLVGGPFWLIKYQMIWAKIAHIPELKIGFGAVLIILFFVLHKWANKFIDIVKGVVIGILVSLIIEFILTANSIDWKSWLEGIL